MTIRKTNSEHVPRVVHTHSVLYCLILMLIPILLHILFVLTNSDICLSHTEKAKVGEWPSPATAAQIMPPPLTGRFCNPAAHALTTIDISHTSSTPRPQQRKKRRRAAQQGHVLLTQDSPGSSSPHVQGEQCDSSALISSQLSCHGKFPVGLLSVQDPLGVHHMLVQRYILKKKAQSLACRRAHSL